MGGSTGGRWVSLPPQSGSFGDYIGRAVFAESPMEVVSALFLALWPPSHILWSSWGCSNILLQIYFLLKQA